VVVVVVMVVVVMVVRCMNLLYCNAGFQFSFGQFAFYLLNIVVTSLAGCSVALVFSASTRQHSIGTILTALVWVCMMVFSGLLVKLSTVPLFLQWIKWFSIFRYSMSVSTRLALSSD